jgi:PAS domain S-box-containing protein
MDENLVKILQVLSNEKKSLNIKEISEKTGINRHTVARKLDILEITGKVKQIQIGRSKKYFLKYPIPLSSIYDISSDLILIINQQWKIEYMNQTTRTKFNLSEEEILGKYLNQINLEIFSSPEVFEGLKNFSPQKIVRMNISWEHQDTLYWYRLSILNFPINQDINLIAIVAVDITEEKMMYEQVIESEAKYRTLFEYAPVAINEEDYSSIYQYISEYKLSGIANLREHFKNDSEFVRECLKRIKINNMNIESRKICKIGPNTTFKPLLDLYPYLTKESIDIIKNMILDLFEGKQSINEEITCINRGKRSTYYIQMTVSDELPNNLSRVFVSFKDITDKKY